EVRRRADTQANETGEQPAQAPATMTEQARADVSPVPAFVPPSPSRPEAMPATPAGKPGQRQKPPTAPPPMPAGASGPVPAPRAAAPNAVVQVVTDPQVDATIPTNSPLFMHDLGGDMAAPPSWPAVPMARPAAPAARPASAVASGVVMGAPR